MVGRDAEVEVIGVLYCPVSINKQSVKVTRRALQGPAGPPVARVAFAYLSLQKYAFAVPILGALLIFSPGRGAGRLRFREATSHSNYYEVSSMICQASTCISTLPNCPFLRANDARPRAEDWAGPADLGRASPESD